MSEILERANIASIKLAQKALREEKTVELIQGNSRPEKVSKIVISMKNELVRCFVPLRYGEWKQIGFEDFVHNYKFIIEGQ